MNEFQHEFYRLVEKYLAENMNIGDAQIAAINEIQLTVARTGKVLSYV